MLQIVWILPLRVSLAMTLKTAERPPRALGMTNVLLTGFLAALVCGCSSETPSPAKEFRYAGAHPIKVVATTGMVADLVRNVGGEHVTVEQLMGPGVDPHLAQVTRDDVQSILQADMVFYSGLMLEGKMSETLQDTGRSKPVIAVTADLPESFLLKPDDGTDHHDPHVWMDVSAWSQAAGVVADQLARFDPVNAESYQQNLKEYQSKLEALHQYGLKSLATIPESRRVLITSHDAFNYFGRAYNLRVLGVQGISTESEAGLRRINELVDLLVEEQVQAVFVETSVPQKMIQSLIDGAASRGHKVVIGGELFSDAMGPLDKYEGTYIGMLDHNITTVTRALGGMALQRGSQGLLGKTVEGSAAVQR